MPVGCGNSSIMPREVVVWDKCSSAREAVKGIGTEWKDGER